MTENNLKDLLMHLKDECECECDFSNTLKSNIMGCINGIDDHDDKVLRSTIRNIHRLDLNKLPYDLRPSTIEWINRMYSILKVKFILLSQLTIPELILLFNVIIDKVKPYIDKMSHIRKLISPFTVSDKISTMCSSFRDYATNNKDGAISCIEGLFKYTNYDL